MRYIYLVEFDADGPVAFETKEDAYKYVCSRANDYSDKDWLEEFNGITKDDFIRGITTAYEDSRGFCFGVTGICTITAIRFYGGRGNNK